MSGLTNSPAFIKPFKWLALALGIKLFLYLLFIAPDHNPQRKFSGFFIKSSDHAEYIKPIDNFIDKGTYAMDGFNEPYAGRLPGFVFPYILFRAIFSESISHILLGVFILLMATLASYALGLLLFNVTKKRWAFLSGFLLINFIPYFWHYEWTLHTSSLGVSCLIFFAYYFQKYTEFRLKKHLLYAGFFLAWLVLLRGFCLVYLPITLVFLFMFEKKTGKRLKEICIAGMLFLIPFIIAESVWITRNFISLHKFIPLQTSFVPGGDSKNQEYGYTSMTKYSLTKVRELIFMWGGENAWYFPDSDIYYFSWKGRNTTYNYEFDKSIFFDGFTKDTLIALRNDVLASYQDSLTPSQHDSIENKIIATANHLKQKFKTNKTGYFYFKAPFKRLKNYLFRNITQDWPGPGYKDSNFLQKSLKLLSLVSYAFLLLQLLLFPFFYLKYRNRNENKWMYLLWFVLLAGSIFPFMFLIAMAHYTYFIFGFTLLIPIFVFNLSCIISKNKK